MHNLSKGRGLTLELNLDHSKKTLDQTIVIPHLEHI
jgi:hypothetical protein